MDWAGIIFVVAVLATVVGLVRERRRRRTRLGGPSHPGEHAADAPQRATWQAEPHAVDQRFGGYSQG